MSDEIKASVNVRVVNGAFADQFTFSGTGIDQSAIGRGGYVQSIATTETVIDFGDVVTNGYMILRNLDTANYVTYGPENAGAMVVTGKLKPGEFAIFRVAPTVVMRAKAETLAVLLDVRLYED